VTGRPPNGEGGVGPPDGAATGDDLPREYAPVRSVDTGAVALIAAGDSRIALASVSGGISVLAPEAADGAQFGVEGRPRGLAVGSLVYVAVDDRVFGYGLDGSRRWEAPLDGVTALCWVPGPSRVVAATDAGEFVLLDAADGSERGRIDRTHADVSETVLLAGRNDEFLAGESWYLTGFDADGRRRGEAMLDGMITGVGLLDGVAVASLHGDRVVGIDADDGSTQWSRPLDVDWLAQRGDGELYAAAADRGIVRLTADGDVTDVGVVAADSAQVATTTDGGLACRIDGRTAEVLRPRASLSGVELELTPASLRVDEDLVVAVENRGGSTTGTVRVSAQGASFRPESRRVSLDAGDRTDLRFTLTDATDSRAATHASFAPADADSDPLETRATLSIRASTPTPAVDTRTVGIEAGIATVEATVHMPDGSDLPAVSLSPGDVDIASEPGQSSASRTLSLPLGTDRLTATTADGESVDTALSLPAAPLSASVDARDDGFVDVTVANDAGVPVDDDVRVTGAPLSTSVERSVSLSPGDQLTLVLPAAHAGAGEVRVDAAVVDTAVAVSLDRAALSSPDDPDPTPARRGDPPRSGPSTARDAGTDASVHAARDDPSAAPPDREPVAAGPDRDTTQGLGDPGVDEHRPTGSSAPPDDRHASPRDAVPESADENDTQRDRPDRDADRRPARREAPPADETQSPRSDTASEAGARPDVADADSPEHPSAAPPSPDAADPSDHPVGPVGSADPDDPVASTSRDPIDLTRRLESDAARAGHAVEELLTLQNHSSEPQSVTLRSDGVETTVELRPESSATTTRYHAGWDAASIEMPGVTACVDEFEATVPAASIPVESAPVVVRPALSVRSDTTDVRLDVHNDLDTACSVLEIGSRGFSTAVRFEEFEVDPGGEGTRETTYKGTPAERPALTFVRTDRQQRPLQTLAAVHESTTPPVSVVVDAVDVLGDRDTNVVLRIRNDGGAPLDVRVEAVGTAPDEYLYAAGEFEGLEPGATVTHRIECTAADDHIELPVELEATPVDGGGDSRSTTVSVSGDRTADAGSWQVDVDEETSALPAALSTPLDADSTE